MSTFYLLRFIFRSRDGSSASRNNCCPGDINDNVGS